MPSKEQIDDILDRFADGFSQQQRSPVLHSPSDQGLDYEDVTFPARDGVPLEGWFIPAAGSENLVILNHPMGFTRSGMPTHLEPWRSVWAASGNGFEVDFVPDYRILHDAGYHVLTYDLRNHGSSSVIVTGARSHGPFGMKIFFPNGRVVPQRADQLASRRVAVSRRSLGPCPWSPGQGCRRWWRS
jgi:uncharacterized protein